MKILIFYAPENITSKYIKQMWGHYKEKWTNGLSWWQIFDHFQILSEVSNRPTSTHVYVIEK